MEIWEDERAQTSAEMILLMGGVIVIAIIALLVYRNYTRDLGGNIQNSEVNEFNNSLHTINAMF